jgi:hypothetical protein
MLERCFTFPQVRRVQVRIDGESGTELRRENSSGVLPGAVRRVSVLRRWMVGIVDRGE